MRIWSLHPKYLDTKGLVALWRETLLAKHVLEGRTKGYKNHPQLDRFKKSENPTDAINQYLAEVYDEAIARNYNFDKDKIGWDFKATQLTVTNKQLAYEANHLLNKLQVRDLNKYDKLKANGVLDTHSLFYVIEGEIEDWEILTSK
ncbi:hypothetical protein GM921_02905 [Pedobacter sp. LMG 31464]|uniref:Pyrimidine dimer DNA glycosylase /DNA-(Apurinic or apyrimidinic site) lyase n=1 Tax=Pedobacter planticolens TaxID=2679964 RepID=A0A923IUQ7_9SPHI|nr:pyrimidine dimer DNA glycosylase/endonuclease V [Pedobacter planticolens]MBB2144419.1 hypothetical protein [Pedobacter planticolens]